MTTYNATYFIKKFEAIPDEMWTTGQYVSQGKKCALGHCNAELVSNKLPKEAKALSRLFRHKLGLLITDTNDNRYDRYPQPTPKARILAALEDIKRAGG